MKKLFSSLLVLTALLAGSNAMARNVSLDEAKTAAVAFLRANTDYSRVSVDDLTLIRQDNNEKLGVPAAYFFNVSDWGFIIMTGSTAMDAVMGYSYCGTLDLDRIPDAMESWVGGQINAVRDVQLLDAERAFDDTDEWTLLLSGADMPAPKADGDIILMTETWDQGDNNGSDYNKYCPVVDGKYCYTGCVATAMAQIMHYYRYPVQPTGRKSYRTRTHNIQISVKFDTVIFDYSKMPDKIGNTTSRDKRLEISKLGYMAGVSVNMNYTPDGSSAYSSDVPAAMHSKFKYETGTLMYRKSSFPHEAMGSYGGQTIYWDEVFDNPNWSSLGYYGKGYSDDDFLAAIRYDIRHNRPVYMGGVSSSGGSGRDAAGHAFVVCGYRETASNGKKYYFNWGWSGVGNGWFNLDDNNMPISGGYGNYNMHQDAVTGMIPMYADSTDIEFLGIDEIETPSAVLESAYPNPATYSVNIPYHLNAAADMYIYSMDGRMVDRVRLEAGDDEAEVRVDRLPAGIYIYRVNGACGKFMVQ